MKKQIILLLFAYMSCLAINAQNRLMVHKGDKGLYLQHTVEAKQSFYSIGRLYNVPPKDLAAFNKLDMNNGLQLGQLIQVPLAAYNFSQKNVTGTPVYYQVSESEGLYRVSVNNNNVPLDNLRLWNNLANDNIHVGSNLVVGYLAAGEMLTSASESNEMKKEEPPAPPKPEIAKNEPVKEAKKETEPIKQETTKVTEPVKEIKPERSETLPVNTSTVAATGYFSDAYQLQAKKITPKKQLNLISGIFKTASGWQDGKYYLLIDDVEPGMIVKITNPTNSRFVYAKVLGAMSGIRQNQGYGIRMSNAAASVLGIEDEKFNVTVNY
ncbi:MAG: LysM peptidoglycan-binding domain-containing protein [Chitinophagaceae bacterium]|jgi:LysM repeat protein|nr:LysM peptidoglycan-binding domain-containing protein [Chitinophagaceae bacterium]